MDLQQQIQQFLASQQNGASSPLLLPRMQIMQVDGETGARNAPIGPESSCLAIDRTHKGGLLVWFIQTDQVGNKTTVADYDMTPHVHEEPPDFNKLQSLIESMATKLDQQIAANDELTKQVAQQTTAQEELFKRVNSIEEVLK